MKESDELLWLKGIVDLPPPRALDKAQAFLERQGYAVVRRTATTLTAELRGGDYAIGEGGASRLVIMAVPQPEGGVKMKVRGTDREGVRERQGLWELWAKGLPTRGLVPEPRVTLAAAKESSGRWAWWPFRGP